MRRRRRDHGQLSRSAGTPARRRSLRELIADRRAALAARRTGPPSGVTFEEWARTQSVPLGPDLTTACCTGARPRMRRALRRSSCCGANPIQLIAEALHLRSSVIAHTGRLGLAANRQPQGLARDRAAETGRTDRLARRCRSLLPTSAVSTGHVSPFGVSALWYPPCPPVLAVSTAAVLMRLLAWSAAVDTAVTGCFAGVCCLWRCRPAVRRLSGSAGQDPGRPRRLRAGVRGSGCPASGRLSSVRSGCPVAAPGVRRLLRCALARQGRAVAVDGRPSAARPAWAGLA